MKETAFPWVFICGERCMGAIDTAQLLHNQGWPVIACDVV